MFCKNMMSKKVVHYKIKNPAQGRVLSEVKAYASFASAFCFSRKRIPKSRNWLASTGAGA